MHAYVFWHWPQRDVPRDDYEARQKAFHAALSAAPPAGYHGSFTHAVHGAPWAAAGGDAYEDWYLVESSASLDPLNTGAITASRQAPHDAAAAAVAGGTAGIYTLRAGERLDRPTHATWFGKPEGMRYDELMSRLQPLVERGEAALWMRFMVLGPSPEFCLQSRAPIQLPSEIRSLSLALRPVWPDASGPGLDHPEVRV
jgi:hypothetical protein